MQKDMIDMDQFTETSQKFNLLGYTHSVPIFFFL